MLRSDIKEFILRKRENASRGCFQFDAEGLDNYIDWSFHNNFLLYAINDVGISGVAMAYPLPRRFDNSLVSLLPSNEKVESEENADLCVMDWAADDAPSRRALVYQFCKRYPNWMKQDKWGVQYGVAKKLNNQYINKLATI
jgi:hypothetical protein